MPASRIDVLGVGVDAVGPEQVRRWLDQALTEQPGGRCRQVVTLNPEYVVAARRNEAFARVIAEADLVVADGAGVLVAGWLLGRTAASRLRRTTGVDLCAEIASACARSGAPLYLLGGRDGAAAGAAAALVARAPALEVAGTWEGGTPGPNDDAESLERIGRAGARAVLVAYGAPGQVTWIARNRDALAAAGVRVAVGVGGAFDVLSGRVPRAPRLVRRFGLEWLFRLSREPWRWRRQLALARFAGLVARSLAGRTWDRLTGRRPGNRA